MPAEEVQILVSLRIGDQGTVSLHQNQRFLVYGLLTREKIFLAGASHRLSQILLSDDHS